MNIASPQSDVVIAKTYGCREMGKQRVAYALSGEFHSLCMDKKDLLQAEMQACEKLLKYAVSDSERKVIEKEITELRMVLDLMP